MSIKIIKRYIIKISIDFYIVNLYREKKFTIILYVI